MKNLSIKSKLILIQSATAFIAMLICSGIFVINDLKIFKESALRKMHSVVRIVGDNSVSPLLFMDKDALNKILLNLSKEPDIQEVIVADKTGEVFGKYSRTGAQIIEFHMPDTGRIMSSEFSGKNLLIRYKIFQENEFLGTIFLRAELSDFNKIIFNYILVAGLVLFAGLLAAILISVFLQRSISKRLLMLVSKIEEVAKTANYSTRVPTESKKDEITILIVGFNSMMEQIEIMETSLQKVNLDLEKRVKERTAELETANKEMESFSYSVSHDLRAPIRAINSFIKIVEKNYYDKLGEEGRQFLKIISDEALRMGRLIDDLLAFSRLGRKEIEKIKVDMTALVNESVNEILKLGDGKYKAEIIVKDLSPALCDPALIRQVWINLISNSLKFSKAKSQPLIEIGSYSETNHTVYFIKDNGVGFDMKYYNKLFGVFQRLHSAAEFEGTGIGLAIVQRTIDRHGGKVWAEAKTNDGAQFYFSLPSA